MLKAIEIVTWGIYLITLYYSMFWFLTFLELKEKKVKKKLKNFPMVTVLIPAYNEEDTIIKTMTSVIELDYPKDKIELIVVNDGSKDATPELVKRFIKKHKDRRIILINQKNSGKWVCLNRGLKIAKGEFFVCLDADSFITKNALKKMLLHFEDDKTAVVLPIMKVKNPKNILQKIQWYEYIVNMFYQKMSSSLNCLHVAPGPFSLYKTEILKKVGGFKYGFATEDLEIVFRLQKYHYRIIQVSEAEVYTIAPDNFKAFYKQRKRWNKGSLLNAWSYKEMAFNRNYGDFAMMQMPTLMVLGLLGAVLFSIILYYGILKPLYKLFVNVVLVRFDIWTLLRNINLDMNILDINFQRLAIALIALGVSVIMFMVAHSHTKEKIVKYGIIPVMIYLFVYYLALGMVWLAIMKDVIVRQVKNIW